VPHAQPDVNRVGGIGEAQKVWAMAAAHDIPVIPHAGQAHNYHLVIFHLNSPLAAYFSPPPEGVVPDTNEAFWWIFTGMFVRVWDLFQAGDVAGARRALHRVLPLLLLAGQSFAALGGTQKEWLRRVGVIQSAQLRAPADQVSEDLYADFAMLLEEARDHGA
jgi:hypothetical protein